MASKVSVKKGERGGPPALTVSGHSLWARISLQASLIIPGCWEVCFNCTSRKSNWRRKWQPAPAFLPGESHGQRSLVSYSSRGHKESDMTKVTYTGKQNGFWWISGESLSKFGGMIFQEGRYLIITSLSCPLLPPSSISVEHSDLDQAFLLPNSL